MLQAGIVQNGGLDPLIDLVESHAESLQHNAAFALYGLADNPDNIAGIIKAGGAQRLQNADLIAQVCLPACPGHPVRGAPASEAMFL